EDARGAGGGGGRGIGLPHIGVGGIVILIIAYFIGGPNLVMNLIGSGVGTSSSSPAIDSNTPRPAGAPTDEASDLSTRVLGSTEDVWGAIFAQSGERYTPPHLVLYSEAINSACGYNTSATGPFYCPGDERLYLDTSFFGQLAQMGGPGDFAQAYVIGH